MAHLDTLGGSILTGVTAGGGLASDLLYDPDGNVIEVHQVDEAEDQKTNG